MIGFVSRTSTAPPMRICIVAEHASRRFGGEALLPYHYFRILRSRNEDAWLIVHDRTRHEMEQTFAKDIDRILFVADTRAHKLLSWISERLPRRIAEATSGLAGQLLTQAYQRSLVRKLATERCVVHQPIPVSPRFPSLLWNLGVPVVIGPMNGGMEYPPGLRNFESWVSRIAIPVGRRISSLVHRLLPGKRHASVLLVANERTRAALPAGLCARVLSVPENGVDLAEWRPPSQEEEHTTGAGASFFFVGRLVDWKALDIVIEALQSTSDSTLHVIGDGPMREPWQALAKRCGLEERVFFHGWLPQRECACQLNRARALVLPSVYESGGAVVLESMAMGKAVIATAWGGPVDYLDETCGILVPPTSRAALIAGFAAAMQQLQQAPAWANQLGARGRAKVLAQFDWVKKVETMLEIYDSCLPQVSETDPAWQPTGEDAAWFERVDETLPDPEPLLQR